MSRKTLTAADLAVQAAHRCIDRIIAELDAELARLTAKEER